MNLLVRVSLLFLPFLIFPRTLGALPGPEVRRDVHLMGTVASLRTFAADREVGLGRLEGFLRILEDSERDLSTWQPESDISRLNRQPIGMPFPLEGSLCRLFLDLQIWRDRTRGAFDPALGALVEAWGLRTGGNHPSPEELSSARKRTGLNHLHLDRSTCHVIRRQDVLIDVGGFGKGEALDRVLDYSVKAGFDGWMIDLGGQIMVHGNPPDRESWTIDLSHPVHRRKSALTLDLVSGSLATSGGSERDVKAGEERIGHILDPRSGLPVVSDVSVAVWHPSALVADILSTAMYVMGVEEGIEWAETHDIAICFLVPLEVGNVGSDVGGDVDFRASPLFERMFLKH